MPTGYTAGILDGTIKDFPTFAKQCMRAFGATIHMREEPASKEYEPRVPSDYHKQQLGYAMKDLEKLGKMSDIELLDDEGRRLKECEREHIKGIAKVTQQKKKLDNMFKEIRAWKPPTPDHEEFKTFMEGQIKSTIEYDGNSKYHDEGLVRTQEELKCLNAGKIRKGRLESILHDIEYHSKEWKAEIERCDEANEWVNALFESLNKKNK